MRKTEKQILKVLRGEKPDHIPAWLMRQAGRYLPEYRKLREKAGSFLNLCLTPEWASEVTLQPIKRFHMDAAILFADILLVPMALGQKLEFKEKEGPVLEALKNDKDIKKLKFNNEKVLPVYETLVRVKSELPKDVALTGFCGAPWTVACYMIDGTSRSEFAAAKKWAADKPDQLKKLIDVLVDASEAYLSEQIEAGAEIIQIFDSWAGLLQGEAFRRWVIEPTAELVRRLKDKYPEVPIIGFPRGAGEYYRHYALDCPTDAISIDQFVDLDFAKARLQTMKILQGNLDPQLLIKGGKDMKKALDAIMDKLGPTHIMNLGHGVFPETPPEHVADFVKHVHAHKIA